LELETDGACELVDLRLQLENAKCSVAHKDLLKCDTVRVVAMAEPVEAMLHLAVPWLVLFPIHFLNVT
jgi:hypothetical protein